MDPPPQLETHTSFSSFSMIVSHFSTRNNSKKVLEVDGVIVALPFQD